MSKWYICRHQRGQWTVCPPVVDCPGWEKMGDVFGTGAEALAAFAEGGAQ